MTINTSKYDMRLNPVYQVDWSAAASGKRVSATKRRVRWRFGFSNADAISDGLTGTNCRGEEHEVVLVWSFTSGKRLVIADGREVHFSMGKRTDTRFETSWTMNGGHILKVIAHMTPPVLKTPGFRQFDLLLDGCSFFDMPRIFELGTRAQSKKLVLTPDPLQTVGHNDLAAERSPFSPTSVAQDESFSNEQKHYEDTRCFNSAHFGEGLSSYSVPERRSVPPSPPPRDESSVGNNFAYPSPPPPVSHSVSAPELPADILSNPIPGAACNDHLATSVQTMDRQQPLQSALKQTQDEFTPRQVVPETPSFQTVANEIMNAYTPTSNPPFPVLAEGLINTDQVAVTPTGTPQYHEPRLQYHSPQPQPQPQPHHEQPASPHILQSPGVLAEPQLLSPTIPQEKSTTHSLLRPTMEPISIEEIERRERPPLSEMERAMKDLVNLSDIKETLETPEQLKEKAKKVNNQSNKSKPAPPTAPDWHLGMNAPLEDIKKHAQPKAGPAKEIMRTHAFDPAAAEAGMMVVYGTALPAATGFGAGVHSSRCHGYGQQVYATY